MKGRLYIVGVIGIIMMVLGVLLDSEIKEALQWIGTGMFVSFVFLITPHFKKPDKT